MAKVRGVLAGAQGRLGENTLYNTGGNTIMRKAETNAVDQKTLAQYVQRVIAKTAMDQYSAMQMLANHSFQGIPMGRKSMARFLKLNMNYFRNRAIEIQQQGGSIYSFYQFARVGQTKFVPAAVYLSEGKLPRVIAFIEANGSSAYITGLGGNTYGDVIEAVNAKRGDQLTFVTVEKSVTTGDYNFRYARVILDPRTQDGSAAPLTSQFSDNNGNVQFPNVRNQGKFALLTGTSGNKLSFNIGNEKIAAAGVIVSRKGKNGWMRSDCKLIINESVIGDDLMSLGDAAETSQNPDYLYVDSEEYLNNAGTGGAQGVVTNDQTITGLEVAEVVLINGVSQNVNGGSVYVASLDSIEVQGQHITSNDLTLEQQGSSEEPYNLEAAADGLSATWQGNIAASSAQQVWKVRKSGSDWFYIIILPERPVRE